MKRKRNEEEQNLDNEGEEKDKLAKRKTPRPGSELKRKRNEDEEKDNEGEEQDKLAKRKEEAKKAKDTAATLKMARRLDSGDGEGGLSGEPAQPFVTKLVEILLNGETFLDLGCGSGCFLYELARLRKDLILWGIEVNEVRLKLAKTVHMHLPTTLERRDILEMEDLPKEVQGIFMHDTVWTPDVVAHSTWLVLNHRALRTVVCVKPRSELVQSGQYVVSQKFAFDLRGGGAQKTATVYVRLSTLDVHGLRALVSSHTETKFSLDREFYVGETEAEKRKDMEVRLLIGVSRLSCTIIVLGPIEATRRRGLGRRAARNGLFAHVPSTVKDCNLYFRQRNLRGEADRDINAG